LKLSRHGNKTFSELGYLTPTRWDLVSKKSGWKEVWQSDPRFQECKAHQIHACCPEWKKVPPHQLNTSYFDPQAME
jgi:hypothetical protein